MFLLYHGDYSNARVIAISPTREPLDEWIVQYEAITPRYAREDAFVDELSVGAPPAPTCPEWATESDEEHTARLAADVAANPGAYLSTGSTMSMSGFPAYPL